jgi:hypothetical protein
MSLKAENSRRIAKSRPVCMDLNTCNFYCDFRCDFLLLMDVNEWISYECSDEGPCTSNIRNSSTRQSACIRRMKSQEKSQQKLQV